MPDIQPPSFSLGLDSDSDSDSDSDAPHPHPPSSPPPCPTFALFHEQNIGPLVVDSEEEHDTPLQDSDPDPPRALKRLRRGTPAPQEPTPEKTHVATPSAHNPHEEIEEFSSQEGFLIGGPPSIQHNSVCSSSKVSLCGHGVLSTQSSSHWKPMKQEQVLDVPATSSLETGCNGLMFPKLTISPLRRFRLIDSDSEEPSIGEDILRTKNIDTSSKGQQFTASELRGRASVDKNENEDLWHDFCPIKSFRVPTPVLDEVCEEYFQTFQNKNVAQKLGSDLNTWEKIVCHQDPNNIDGFQQCWNMSHPLPPAHQYFFNDDPRIQRLVRTRLPNFSPLGTVNKKGNSQPCESVIDYMGQFNADDSKQKGTQKNSSEKCFARVQIKSKKANAMNVSHASQGWMEPKSSAGIPKDAGKRRVHANGLAAGHWYTSPEGRKVYVSRTGQELTGQIAYRHYKKDNGGFRKSKKKADAKKKSNTKKNG